MKYYKTPLVVGIIGLLTAFLGVPEVYKNWIIGILSLILIFYSIRVKLKNDQESGSESESFVESNGESRNTEEIKIKEEVKQDVLEEAEEMEEDLIKRDEE